MPSNRASKPWTFATPALRGFGVRILPSGSKRYFLQSQSDGKRIWHTIGDAGAITRTEILPTSRRCENMDISDSSDSMPFETVAGEAFRRNGRCVERGIDVSYETVWRWALKFEQAHTRRLRAIRPRPDARRHLDEMFMSVAGKRMHPWHAAEAKCGTSWFSHAKIKTAVFKMIRRDLKKHIFPLIPSSRANCHLVVLL